MKLSAYDSVAHPAMRQAPTNNDEWREFIRVLFDGPLGKISGGGDIGDIRALPQSVLSNRPSVMLTAALTGTDDASVPRINIAAHTVTYSTGDIDYNSGSVIVAGFETTYYVFARDPLFRGGAVPYFAFISPDLGVADDFRYVGAVITPALGAPDTDGGYGGGFGTGEDNGGNPWP